MFTYIDPDVRRRLIAAGKLIRINAEGQVTAADQTPVPGARAISILGPIPLPLELDGQHYEVSWYASVRHTELAKAQELGASVFVPPQDIPGVGRFAVLADPVGAAFALYASYKAC